jgi:hypothetical protein
MPLKVTVLDPCWSPKLVPVIVIGVPTVACPGESEIIVGISRNDCALLETPLTVTTTLREPTGKVDGSVTTMFVSFHEVAVTVAPPKVTVPGWVPKFVPLMVTGPPAGGTGPTDGDRLVMLGAVWAKTGMKRSDRRTAQTTITRVNIESPLSRTSMATKLASQKANQPAQLSSLTTSLGESMRNHTITFIVCKAKIWIMFGKITTFKFRHYGDISAAMVTDRFCGLPKSLSQSLLGFVAWQSGLGARARRGCQTAFTQS